MEAGRQNVEGCSSEQLFRFLLVEQARQGIVTLRQAALFNDGLNLVVFRLVDGDRFRKLYTSHRIAIQPNEGSISLLAFAEFVLRLFPV